MKVDYTKYFLTLGAQARFWQALRTRGHVGIYSVCNSPHLHSSAKKARRLSKLVFQLPSVAQGEKQTLTENNLFPWLANPKYPISSWDGSLSKDISQKIQESPEDRLRLDT